MRPDVRVYKRTRLDVLALQATLFTVPFEAVGIGFGGNFLEVAFIPATAFILLSFRLEALKALKLRGFALILSAGLGAIFFAPDSVHGIAIWAIFAVAVVFGCCVAAALTDRAITYRDLVLPLLRGSVLLASVAIAQSLVANVLRIDVSFAPLNIIAQNSVWRPPGTMGVLVRASGLAPEPAHLVQVLAPAIAFAFMRLGLIGAAQEERAADFISRKQSFVIMAAVLASLSVIGWIIGILIAVALVTRGKNLRLGRLVLPAIAIVVLLAFAFPTVGGALVGKTSTVGGAWVAYSTDQLPDSARTTDSISSLTIAANASVTSHVLTVSPLFGEGLGSHPYSYKKWVPAWVSLIQPLVGLNSLDAGSLLLRLLSEQGLLGLALWLATIWMALRLARKSVDRPEVFVIIATVVVIALLRYPVYQWLTLWTWWGVGMSMATES